MPLPRYTHKGPARLRFCIYPISPGEDPAEKSRRRFAVGPSPIVSRGPKGRLILHCDPDIPVEVSVNSERPSGFDTGLPFAKGGVVDIRAVVTDDFAPTVAPRRGFGRMMDRTSWTATVSSDDSDGSAAHLIDGDKNTF